MWGRQCAGLCETTRMDVAKRVASFDMGQMSIVSHHAEVVFGGKHQHAFIIVKTDGGKTYLVDPTLIQFFVTDDQGQLDEVGSQMRSVEQQKWLSNYR